MVVVADGAGIIAVEEVKRAGAAVAHYAAAIIGGDGCEHGAVVDGVGAAA